MSAEPDLVALLYRADWTRLSLSAEVTVERFGAETGEAPEPARSTVLIAPGRRYLESGDGLRRGCDGERAWEVFEPPAGSVRVFGGPALPFHTLLCPSWLLSGFTLETRDTVTVCGRDAVRVTARPRPGAREWPAAWDPGFSRSDRVEAVVDAELGILLRCERVQDGRTAERTDITALTLGPPADPARFEPPPGSTISEDWRAAFGGPGWWIPRTAGSVAATILGEAIRHSARRSGGQGHDEGGTMPADDDPPAEGGVSDELLHLLYRGGSADFAATLDEWHDVAAFLGAASGATGIGGLEALAGAVAQRMGTIHRTAGARFAGPARYRIEYAVDAQNTGIPRIIACDGEHRWRVYDDRVLVAPATALPGHSPFAYPTPADASWLLGCRLSGGRETVAGDRRAFLVTVDRVPGLSFALPQVFSRATAVVDAELGIVLRLTQYTRGQAATRYELRDVTTAGLAEFRVDIPSGLRISEETGNPVDDLPMPEPVRAAMRTAASAARAAGDKITAARGFLDELRGRSRR